MKNNSQYVCWINNESKVLSFHNVSNYIQKSFNNYKEFFTFVIFKCQKGYKVQ